MGQGLEVLKACDGTQSQGQQQGADRASSSQQPRREHPSHEGAPCGCAALEDGVKHAVATVKRGGNRISDDVLLNHELLQSARQGNVKGISAALEKGAWTETRRPLVMKPQKPPERGADDEACGDGLRGRREPGEVGMTALMFSAQAGSVECVRRLLWASAELNAVEEDGWSALHFAAKEGHMAVCMALLESRADPELHDADDRTPLQVAAEEDDEFADSLRGGMLRHLQAQQEGRALTAAQP